jgi:hypothetical protein
MIPTGEHSPKESSDTIGEEGGSQGKGDDR